MRMDYAIRVFLICSWVVGLDVKIEVLLKPLILKVLKNSKSLKLTQIGNVNYSGWVGGRVIGWSVGWVCWWSGIWIKLKRQFDLN